MKTYSESELAAQMHEGRVDLQNQLRRVESCRTPEEKRSLYEDWLRTYPKDHVQTLVNIVKDGPAMRKILKWKLTGFDEARLKAK